MKLNDSVFSRFSPLIQDYIYADGWESLRPVQVAAAQLLFERDCNVLLTSATASGKTEAAFFPVITELSENPPATFGALYIAPLKSLINDQFSRLDHILDMSGIPVFHWHGDVAQSHKKKAMQHPSGILQITPESLEAMLMRCSGDLVRLFGDLRYAVIDEVHTLTGSDRGNQVICQLNRIARAIGYQPRRIGLSATVGDTRIACEWLGAGSGRETVCPELPKEKIRWRLGVEHFFIQNPMEDQNPASAVTQAETVRKPILDVSEEDEEEAEEEDEEETEAPDTASGRAALDPGYEYLYDCTKGKKCLVFSNSREETEYVTATLRQIAAYRGEPDRFLIHHGNLSASLREEAELRLKNEDAPTVTCATVTLELGVDIGRLERVLQIDAPYSVSSFLQRLGRSGRRGEPPEMIALFREENPLPNTPLPQMIPWGLLRMIAIVQLYLEERFIEPPRKRHLPFSLLFHQTLSILTGNGAMTARELADRALTLPAFSEVTKEQYKCLLTSMLEQDILEMTEEKELMVGLRGERLTNSFRFYATFPDSEDYTVRAGSDEIGTTSAPPAVGDRFALAGRVWEVEELDLPRRLIYVHAVPGKMRVEWPGDSGEVHTRILERMRQVLEEDTVYPYLKPNACRRLEEARVLARSTGMTQHSVVCLGGMTWCLFPWLGTRSFRTLRKYLAKNGAPEQISHMDYEGCFYITFKMNGDGEGLIRRLCADLERNGLDCTALADPRGIPYFDKYDSLIPSSLLAQAYAVDRLRADEVLRRLPQIRDEFNANS